MTEPETAPGAEPAREPGFPARVGPFRLLERLGEGGMGVVFLAERHEPAQRVALKIIRTDRLDRTYRARFAMEQEALARMDHPNIARLFDAGDAGGQSWFAMEYVPGQSLTDYCAEHRLPLEQRLLLFAQICEGVQHAHMKGILHRDLKPGNVLVREIDGRAVAKIIDFGLAQPVDPVQIRATLHEAAHQVVGTIAYMSPEQASRTEGDLDTRTDVYSLGVLLYELLTGELPLDLEAVRRRGAEWFGSYLREYEPAKPSTRLSSLGERLSTCAAERGMSAQRLRSFVRGDLDWVTMKALSRDRQRRYPTVRELGRDIERFLRHRPVEAGPPSAFHVARKWLRRHVASASVAALVMVGGVAFAVTVAAAKATQQRLERLNTLDLQLFAAPMLLQQFEQVGVSAQGRDEAEAFCATAARLLLSAGEQEARIGAVSAAQRPFLQRFLTDEVPRLQRAIEDAGRLRTTIEEVEAAMHEQAAAWQRCIAEVVADARYRVASMPPQFGLVPLGKDPRSALFEFACLATGEVPTRDAESGELQLDETSALVLVLLPGGRFSMGTAEGAEGAGKLFAAADTEPERPVRTLDVPAFFLGKGEVSWLHVAEWCEQDPSYWNLERLQDAVLTARRAGVACPTPAGLQRGLPLTNLDWHAARRLLCRVGLRLPSEAEWEYGARADTLGPWSCASTIEDLRRCANLADASTIAAGLRPEETGAHWLASSDGVPLLSPLHSLLPNPFGLHDVHGNVAEWCEDEYRDYDGSRDDAFREARVVRGGSFWRRVTDSRSAARRQSPPSVPDRDVGLRAARSVDGCIRR